MDQTMQQAVLDIVEENLPSSTAGVLRKYIEDAQKTAQELINKDAVIKSLTSKIEDEHKARMAYFNEVMELRKYRETHDAVMAKERELKVTLAEASEKSEHEKVVLMKELVGLVFRNPRVMYSEISSEHVPVSGSATCNGYTQNVMNSKTTTQTVD